MDDLDCGNAQRIRARESEREGKHHEMNNLFVFREYLEVQSLAAATTWFLLKE